MIENTILTVEKPQASFLSENRLFLLSDHLITINLSHSMITYFYSVITW